MKKLLTSLLSVFMALTMTVAVNADDAKVNVGVRYNVPGQETSISYGQYSVGEEVNILPESFNGYSFTGWSYTFYSNNAYKVDFSTFSDNSASFTIPEEFEDGSSIVLTANYTESAKVNGGENTEVWDNTVSGGFEDIVDAVTEEAKNQGITVDSTSTITLNTVVAEGTLTEEQATKIIEKVNELNESSGWDIKESDEYNVVVDYDFQQVVKTADGKEATLEVDDYGSNGFVEVTVTTAVPDSYFEGTPDGYTRYYYIVATHEDGTTSVFSAYDVTSTGFKFWANKNSIGKLLPEDWKNQVDNNPVQAGPKDTNSDGIVDCVEENGKGWVWSQSKNVCVYKVTNTSAK